MKIQIEDKPIVDQICGVLNLPISEYCFSNIFLFRMVHEFELYEIGRGQYGLTGIFLDGKKFYMPLYHPSDWDACVAFAKAQAARYIYPVPEEWWPECRHLTVDVASGDSDYVVETDKIRTYKGRHFDGHRYNIRKLLDSAVIDAMPLEQALIQDAKCIVHEWQQMKEHGSMASDVDPCLEALELLSSLDLKGYVFYIDGLPRGVIIGQPLREDMFVFHFAKAAFPSLGLYQYMYQYFAQQIPDQYTFLNCEQDLGLSGLRKAKCSLHPSWIVQKGRIVVAS